MKDIEHTLLHAHLHWKGRHMPVMGLLVAALFCHSALGDSIYYCHAVKNLSSFLQTLLPCLIGKQNMLVFLVVCFTHTLALKEISSPKLESLLQSGTPVLKYVKKHNALPTCRAIFSLIALAICGLI